LGFTGPAAAAQNPLNFFVSTVVMQIVLQYEGAPQRECDLLLQQVRARAEMYAALESPFALHEDEVKPALQLVPGQSVVEFDTGLGLHLGSFNECKYRGFVANQRMAVVAKKSAIVHGLSPSSVEYVNPKPLRLPVEDCSADAALSVCTLHFYPDFTVPLLELNRALKPRGRIAIVERLCSLGKNPEEVGRIKNEYDSLARTMEGLGYSVSPKLFRASFYGEFMEGDDLFDFFMVSGTKR
jgi:SAM-dependent methyltransferase